MTELQLHKFITDNNVEWHRKDNNGTPDVMIFPKAWDFEAFCELVKGYYNDDGGLQVTVKRNYFANWMKELCEYFDIDMDNVFVGEGTH